MLIIFQKSGILINKNEKEDESEIKCLSLFCGVFKIDPNQQYWLEPYQTNFKKY